MANYAIQSKRGATSTWSVLQGWRAGDYHLRDWTGPIDRPPEIWWHTVEQQTSRPSTTFPPSSRPDGASLLDVSKSLFHLSDTSLISLVHSVYMIQRFSQPYPVAHHGGSDLATPPGC
jgi:hypothetical protein